MWNLILLTLISIFTYGCSVNRVSCPKKETSIVFPHIDAKIDRYDLYDVNFKLKDNTFLLSKREGLKLLLNINTMRVAYVKMLDRYKLAVQNYNDLLDITTKTAN